MRRLLRMSIIAVPFAVVFFVFEWSATLVLFFVALLSQQLAAAVVLHLTDHRKLCFTVAEQAIVTAHNRLETTSSVLRIMASART